MKSYLAEQLQKIINAEINLRSSALDQMKPDTLYSPVKYSLLMGGKRLRPLLLIMGFNLFSDQIRLALPAAISVEVFHNFTLLHDDIMDRSEMRRNSPTVYMKFGENSAILAGDSMGFLSYQILSECISDRNTDVIRLFTKTALEVCEGQQYDMDFERSLIINEAEYLEMIRLKTAVLLGYCLEAGAMLAEADSRICQNMYSLGINLGLAFQLQDDLLDTFGNQKLLGKKIGNDIVGNKKTYLLVKALEIAEGNLKSELLAWLSAGTEDAKQKVKAIIEIYNKLDIKKITEDKINYYFKNAFEIFSNIPVNDIFKIHLQDFISGMQIRKY